MFNTWSANGYYQQIFIEHFGGKNVIDFTMIIE